MNKTLNYMNKKLEEWFKEEIIKKDLQRINYAICNEVNGLK